MSSKGTLVVIVTYNGSKWIEECLQSIYENTSCLDVVIIDNASTDDTIDIILNKFPKVNLIKSSVNLGFGKGNNIGLSIAYVQSYDYVFLLNQDAKIDNDTIKCLIDTQKQNPSYGILSPFHFNWDGSKVDHYFLQMVNPYDCPDFLSDTLLNEQKDIYSLKFIHAACWLISRRCLEEVGGFDPIFPHYGEDNDYVERAHLKGFLIGIVPKVNVYHYGYFDVSQKPKTGKKLQKIQATLELKTIQNKLIGNYIFFFKSKFDDITSYILARKFNDALDTFKIALFAPKIWMDLRKSRRESKARAAFLEKKQ